MAQYDYQDIPENRQKPYYLRYILIFIFVVFVILFIFTFKAVSASLFNKVGKPTHVGEVLGNEVQASFVVDKFVEAEYEKKPTFQLIGWTFPNDLTRPLSNYNRELILVDAASQGYYFEVIDRPRPDVTKHFSNMGTNLDASGYLVNISKKAIPEGLYQIAISFSLLGEPQPMVYHTNYFLERTADTLRLIK